MRKLLAASTLSQIVTLPSTRLAAAQYSRNIGPYLFAIAAACSYYVAIAPFLLGHTDLGWHLAAGDLIRSQGSVPELDPWSFTAGDKHWYNLSWLWDVIESLIFQYGGFTALILVAIFLGATIAGGLIAICLGSRASPIATCVAVISACILYPTFAAPDIFLAASPNIATLLFCVVFYGVCLRRQQLWLAPASMLFWVNMHGGFILGIFILGMFGAIALLKWNIRDFKLFVVTGLACLAATFVNPLGWQVYEGVFGTIGHFVQRYITEWQPYFGIMMAPQSVLPEAYIVAFCTLEIFNRRCAPIEARILSWCFLLLGFWQLRYLSIFFLFSTVPIALHLGSVFPMLNKETAIRHHMAITGLLILCLLPFLYWRVVPAHPGFPPIYPDAELAYVQKHVPQARLLNHWNYGGFIIFRTRGEIPIFVDGRAATAYPDSLLHDYFQLITWDVDATAWEAVLEKYHIDTVLWPKVHTALTEFLVGKRGWTLAYSGEIANVYIKQH
jgi:hypothetical protein